MGIRFVQTDIRKVWNQIKDTLTETTHLENPPEEVYHACRSGTAHLFTVPEGYIIVNELMVNGTKRLHVWIAYGRAGFNLIKEYLPDIEELAKSINADAISFHTNRKGFERALPNGWEQNYIEWMKRIDYGS